ncbi:MAG TPA: DUF883 family protein [Paenalcaligenes sp.]|nr:DUF883 family protein [Paenalcaligenes sp.]
MVDKDNIRKFEEEFIKDVKKNLDEAEKLLKEAADSTGAKANEIREKAMRRLQQSREALLDTQETLARRGRQAIRATDDYVHDKPWQAIGLAGAIGLLLGVLLSRR